jgi:hypothetical protein
VFGLCPKICKVLLVLAVTFWSGLNQIPQFVHVHVDDAGNSKRHSHEASQSPIFLRSGSATKMVSDQSRKLSSQMGSAPRVWFRTFSLTHQVCLLKSHLFETFLLSNNKLLEHLSTIRMTI